MRKSKHGSHTKPPVSRAKAGMILEEGQIGGRPLSEAQKGLFGAVRGGAFGHPKSGHRSKHKKKK